MSAAHSHANRPTQPSRPREEHMRKESTMTDSIQTFLDQWSAAEHTSDTERLDALLARADEHGGDAQALQRAHGGHL